MFDVLVAEDSRVMRELLVAILESDPLLRVIATAKNGKQAVAQVQKLRPHIVVMDAQMPEMDGFIATRQIMEQAAVPVIIVSAVAPQEIQTTFRALAAGALAFMNKPTGIGSANQQETAAQLCEMVRLMAEVPVVTLYHQPKKKETAPKTIVHRPAAIRCVAIGASTGGPMVLQRILRDLPRQLPVPVVIVQHIAQGFVTGLAEWLSESTGFPVQLARHYQTAQPGYAYLAPDDYHLGLDSERRLLLVQAEAENSLRPAISYLFRSLAQNLGGHVLAVLLTGMGRDGARELKLLRECGAITVAQDRQSSLIFGMPAEAIAIGAASHVLPPEKIAGLIEEATRAISKC